MDGNSPAWDAGPAVSPFSVGNGYNWPTDWELSGNTYQTGAVKTGTFYDPNNLGAVNIFSNLANDASSFREPFPGEAGQRNLAARAGLLQRGHGTFQALANAVV